MQLQDSIFYPKGGGQKGDRGVLVVAGSAVKIIDTQKDQYSSDGGNLLIADGAVPEGIEGQSVHTELDWDFRYRQMRLHSCVHLHHCMMEKVKGGKVTYPKTSNIEDGFAFNRYDDPTIDEELVRRANEEMLSAIVAGAEVKTYPDPEKAEVGYRWWESLNYKIPCGGTHIKNLSEIGKIEINFSRKAKMPTITITLVGQ